LTCMILWKRNLFENDSLKKKNLGNETHVNLFQILNGSLLTKDRKIKRSYMYYIYAQLLWVSHMHKESQTCSLVCKF
jgi:hypothetical protein